MKQQFDNRYGFQILPTRVELKKLSYFSILKTDLENRYGKNSADSIITDVQLALDKAYPESEENNPPF